MGPARITVVLTTYWLTGVVGAASLSLDDQYSPYQPLYGRDVAQVPLNYPNWLQYRQEPTKRLEPPDYTLGRRRDNNYILSDHEARKESATRELDTVPKFTGEWKTDSADDHKKSSESVSPSFKVWEDVDHNSAANEDDFVGDDTFQDQGPGSVEIYKLDLHRESSMLPPQANGKHTVSSHRKSKLPKKATAEEILWKLKSIETKTPLPSIFQQPPNRHKDSALSRAPSLNINENHKDEMFAIGGVPELQVGCEGLEASDRQKRSGRSGSKYTNENDWDNSDKHQDPVYVESTEPILLRVTPIVLDLEEEAPPSGEVYEEMDELLKLKRMESTSPVPTTRRWNRADIDPVLEMDKRNEGQPMIDTFPERGDLGPTSNSTGSEIKKSVQPKNLESDRFRRDTSAINALPSSDFDVKADTDDSWSSSSNGAVSLNSRGGRKLLWAQYPTRQEQQHEGTGFQHHSAVKEHPGDADLWGFDENDGALSDSEDENGMDELRQAESDERRREYGRRKQEMNRRLDSVGRDNQPRREDVHYRDRNVNAEIEKIRKEYEKQLERQERERQRIAMKRRYDEETKRRLEEEEKRKEWNRKRDEEERRRSFENRRNHETSPSALTRPDLPRDGDVRKNQQAKESEERKLRDYIERNRPIDPKKIRHHGRPDERTRQDESADHGRHVAEQYKRQMEEERKRKQMEEHQRKQMVEERRQRQWNEEQRRLTEVQRRSNRTESRALEEERRRRLEEEKRLQDYVRRNQPVIVPNRNDTRTFNASRESGLQEQRRTIEAARQWDRNSRPNMRSEAGRVHGPSAPTNVGHRQWQDDSEYRRREQEILEEKRQWEMNRRQLQEEERRREAEYQRAESRRREHERKRLEEIARRDEANRRKQLEAQRNPRPHYQSSRRPSTEMPNREAEELRRRESAVRRTDDALRNQQDEWRRRSDERARQLQQRQHEERERQRLENERNSKNSRRRRPHHEDHWPKPGQRGESVRGGHDAIEWRRREHARLNSLPVSARIILRSDGSTRNGGKTPPVPTSSTSLQPFKPSIGTRSNFDNGIDFPVLTPNRPGLAVAQFPAPPTLRPPAESPGPCVWAVVQCCPANNRLTGCFESMGCPGINWDPSPCRRSLIDAARAEIVKFYQSAEEENTRH